MTNVAFDRAAISKFAKDVRIFTDVVEGRTADLSLCRELRSVLTDLYAAAVHAPELAPTKGQNIPLVEHAARDEIEASLRQRLPREMYWTALLPATYETVGDLGVNTMADFLQEIYGWLVPGLSLFEREGPAPEVAAWWFSGWEVHWGSAAVRCIAILHEVIDDLAINLYGRQPAPS